MSASHIPLERWAELLAHHQHFAPGREAEVLARLGVAQASFLAASIAWSAELGRAAGKDPELVARFARALTDAKERLARDEPAIESLGPLERKLEWQVDATSADTPALTGEALPFGTLHSPEFAAALARGAAALAPAGVGETGAMPAVLVDMNATLPFGSPAVASDPKLTLEQYASLCAELSIYPQRVASIRSRYGFRGGDDQLDEDNAWSTRLAADPASAREWQRLVRHYHAWLLRNPR